MGLLENCITDLRSCKAVIGILRKQSKLAKYGVQYDYLEVTSKELWYRLRMEARGSPGLGLVIDNTVIAWRNPIGGIREL